MCVDVSDLAVCLCCLSICFTLHHQLLHLWSSNAGVSVWWGVCGALRQPLGGMESLRVQSAQGHVVETVLLSIQHVARE